jgi:hypothetical protein
VLGEIDLIAAKLGSNGFLTLVRAVGSSSGYGAGYGAAVALDGKADGWPGPSGLAAPSTLHRKVLDLLARPASTPPA